VRDGQHAPASRGRTLIVLETELAGDDGSLAAKVLQTRPFIGPRS